MLRVKGLSGDANDVYGSAVVSYPPTPPVTDLRMVSSKLRQTANPLLLAKSMHREL